MEITMGTCSYCGTPAGFLRGRHKACHASHKQGRDLFLQRAEDTCLGRLPVDDLIPILQQLQQTHYITDQQHRSLLIEAWQKAVEEVFADGLLSEEEENGLITVSDRFQLTQDDLDQRGAFTRVVKGGVLRDLMEGTIPQRLRLSEPLPFNFQKSEALIWVFQGVDYYKQKTRRQRVGSGAGLSIRIAKGIYYRTSAFQSQPVAITETVLGDNGLLAVTNKHLYFGGGSGKSFRVRLDKIVSFEPYSNGIGIHRDTATAKPESFVTGDGWFTFNLVRNAANM